jgi:release factor glutamine methyltransferase
MRLAVLPGVFAPISDSRLLAACLRRELAPGDRRVLDVFTGSGLLALTAARAGVPHVTAIDVSRRAVLGVRLNARLNGVRVRALRGDALAPVVGERFDVIVANPPYVPGAPAPARAPARGRARAWEAGEDGRALLDPLLAHAPALLAGGGRLLVVHSSLCGEQRTLDALRAAGLEAHVLVRSRGPLGPLMRSRAAHLRRRGLIARGEPEEEVLVLCGRRPQQRATVRPRGARAGDQDAAHAQGVRS